MKKLIVTFMFLFLSVVTLGCATTTTTADNGLNNAYGLLNGMYKDASTVTAADYERVSQVRVKSDVYPITWTATVTTGEATDVVITPVEGKAVVKIDVNEKTDVEVKYTLKATITSPVTNNTRSIEYNYTIPKFKELTYTEFAALNDDSNVVVKGVISAVLSKTYGDASNCLYLNDVDGGYYVYNLSIDPVTEGLEVGMTVRVTGLKDTYNGTLEIVSASVEVLDSNKTELVAEDLTEAYKAAADLKDTALVGKQAYLVTVKGVTLTPQSDADVSGGYFRFELAGKSSYIRISSSVCPLTDAEVATFKASHKPGYTADVTGVVCVYDGAFYLTPIDTNAISNLQLPELSDSEAVAYEKDLLTLVESVEKDSSIVLPAKGTAYTKVSIAWEIVEGTCAVVENGKLVINAIDEYTLCSAYDARYNGKAIKGNNISYKVHYTSETLDFDKPTEGKHLVKAVVYNQTKYAEKEFVVIIEDMTAPVVYTQDYIKIGVGEYFNLEDGITYAYDAVDGNLLDHVNGSWYLDISAKKLDVTKAGKYEVVLEVWDSSDNVVEVSYIVEVVSLGNEDLEDAVAANKQAIDELYDLVADGFDDLNEAVEALKPAPEAEKEGCGSSATVTVQLLAAASLLVVFLRKRH